MAEGLQGLIFEPVENTAIEQKAGLAGFDLEISESFALRISRGVFGIFFEKILIYIDSLTFTDLLGIATNHRLDELKITIPDGRIFEIGTDIPWGTINVENCFYDEQISGLVKVSGYKRATWPAPIGYRDEYFEYFI